MAGSEALYPVPALAPGAMHRAEQTIKRSRFICSIAHTETPEEAKAFIERVKTEFADARHNCWAYCAGAPGSTAQVGASDDGEPHGTAGRPMLTVLLHCGTGELTAVVTRYFGGILLGTGGLVRAYQGTLKLALETQLLRLLPQYRATPVESEFGMDAEYLLRLPAAAIEPLSRELTELTAGSVLIEVPEEPAA